MSDLPDLTPPWDALALVRTDTWEFDPRIMGGLAESFMAAPEGAASSLLTLPTRVDASWRYLQSSYSQDNIVTLPDGTTYAVWIRALDAHPIVGKLTPGVVLWATFDLRTIAGDPFGAQAADGHNTFSIAVDAAGNIHVSGNMHNNVLRYARTTTPGNITTFATATMVGTNETSVSYPAFVISSTGDLYFAYRNGGSEQGNIYLNRWTGAAWSRVAQVLNGDASLEGPYINRIAADDAGGLHFMFMWRETPDAFANSDIGYARYTGTGWVQSTGAAQTMPITHANAETVVPLPQNSGLINQTGLAVDIDGRPHGVFTWYDANGYNQYWHVWHDGTAWQQDRVSRFTDTINTAAGISTLDLIVARPQIVCTSTGKTYILGRARSAANNRPHIIDADTHAIAAIFDMDVSAWEPAFDTLAARRDDSLRMLIADLESPGPTGGGYNDQWGGILTLDLSTVILTAAAAPAFGANDAGHDRANDIRGSYPDAGDLNNLNNVDHIGSWLLTSSFNYVNTPAYGATRPALLIVDKPHRTVTVQTLISTAGRVYTRMYTSAGWGIWTLTSGGSMTALANGTALSGLWHGDYLLSSGAANAYPGEPTDFAALNVAGFLEVRLVASSGVNGIKLYRLTSFDHAKQWEATMQSGALGAWVIIR
jgi:hypothetical protein